MKYIFSITTILVLLSSCTTKTDLEGVWIGAYRTEGSDSHKNISSLAQIIEFKGDSAILSSFANPNQLEPQKVEKTKFELTDDLLIFSTNSLMDTFKIRSNIGDSLVLESMESYKSQLVFKRFQPSNKIIEVPKLTGNAFILQGENWLDTLDFLSDSIFVSFQGLTKHKPNTDKWAFNAFRNDQFIIFNYWRDNWPVRVVKITIDTVFLEVESTKKHFFKLIRIHSKKDISSLLIGNWIESWKIPSNNIPPPPCALRGEEYNSFLTFAVDSVYFTLCENTWSKSWELNSTNEFVCFYNSGGLTESWRIVEFCDNKLCLKRKSIITDTTYEYRSYDRIE